MNTLNLPVSSRSIAAFPNLQQKKATLTIDHQPISFKQVLQWTRLTGKLPDALQEILSQFVIRQTLEERTDLDVDQLTVEAAIADFRREQHLEGSQQFQDWLLQQGWDDALFYEQVQFNLKLERFKAELAEPKLLEAFIEQKLLLDQVVLSRIVVDSLELAEELKLQIVEEGVRFEQMAQDYSIAEDAVMNGMMGSLSRAEAQNWFGIDCYQVQVEAIVGAIALDQNWCLLRVEKILPAELTESVQGILQEQIFQQWLTDQIQTKAVTLHLSDD